jgi:hypothetical protein
VSAEKIVIGEKWSDQRELRKFFEGRYEEVVEGDVARAVVEALCDELGIDQARAWKIAAVTSSCAVISWGRGVSDGLRIATKGGVK